MMRHVLRYMLVIVLLAFQARADQPAQISKLTIGTFSFPPLLHVAEDGSFSGRLGETVKQTCERALLECEFKVIPLKRAYNELVNGSVDALVTLDLGQFKECCLVSDWRSPWSAGLFSNDLTSDVPSTKEEMTGKSLIVVNGMRSPYAFLPDMDELSKAGTIKVFKARDIVSSINMFHRKRAPLLWGGDDFKWYLKKTAPLMKYQYKALFEKDVVLWLRQEKLAIAERYNTAFHQLLKEGAIGDDGMLVPALMQERYKEPKAVK